MEFTDIFLTLYFFMWYMLVFVAIIFAVSGLDDLFFDIFYWSRRLYRIWKTRHYKPLTYEQLINTKQQHIAVLLPCWDEANIIGTMLTHNCYALNYENYDIFVGVYPNDPGTVNAVENIATQNSHVHPVIGKDPGPTNKAANLNHVYQYIKEYEKEHNIEYAAFVFHDSEDVIHPLSFLLYNYLIPRKDMIQVPIFPLEVGLFNFTHWAYCDEFCENHTKDIIVREAIHGLVPSAGVGTAFSRKALNLLAADNKGVPFETYSLTEDYKTALAIRLKGLNQIFVSRSIKRTKWRRKWFFFGKYIQVPKNEFIATRALFPMEYKKAVRQKARWITGISLQEWAHTGWVGNFTTRFTLLHDRKAILTHFINAIAYMVFLFWVVYLIVTYNLPQFPNLQEQFRLHPWVWYIVLFATFIMAERMLQRCIATIRVYGWLPAILAIPRIFYVNILNLHALIRALRTYYIATPKSKRAKPKWDKTEHEFPGSHILIPYKKRIGDLLIEKNIITSAQLEKALALHEQTGSLLGDILQQLEFANQKQIIETLATQYQLPLVNLSDVKRLKHKDMPGISLFNYYWLIFNKTYPIEFNKEEKLVRVAISDPSNEVLLKQIYTRLAPYKVEFCLFIPELTHNNPNK